MPKKDRIKRARVEYENDGRRSVRDLLSGKPPRETRSYRVEYENHSPGNIRYELSKHQQAWPESLRNAAQILEQSRQKLGTPDE